MYQPYKELRVVLQSKGLEEEMIQSILFDLDTQYYANIRDEEEQSDYAYEDNQSFGMTDYQ